MLDREQITIVGDGLLVLAPAKINLSLLIAGKRPDGFHKIETVMAKVNWYDEILIEPGEKAGVELVCKGPHWAPPGEDNLVYRAAEMLLEKQRLSADLRITLTKNIPAGTGLGSASSDAAATLVSVFTRDVYVNYEHDRTLYEELHARMSGYIRENRIDLVVNVCANMLQGSCFDLVESLGELKARIESLGIGPCCLSGSGSAMFCIIDREDEEQARQCKCKLEEKVGCKSIIVTDNRW
jgi:4-diphosphocytidyl-2C-methyl-D-erythritol kinase